MASFSKLSTWPVGYFRAFSSWLLRNRRDVAARVQVIGADLARIGDIKVFYRAVEDGNGNVRRTEERVGFSVVAGTTLERLVQA